MVEAFNIIQDRISRARLAGDPPDMSLQPKLGHIGLSEFHRADESIAIGYETTKDAAARAAAASDRAGLSGVGDPELDGAAAIPVIGLDLCRRHGCAVAAALAPGSRRAAYRSAGTPSPGSCRRHPTVARPGDAPCRPAAASRTRWRGSTKTGADSRRRRDRPSPVRRSAPASRRRPRVRHRSAATSCVLQPEHFGRGAFLEEGAQRAELAALDRDAGRHGMAAALDDQAALERLAHQPAEIEAGDERPEPVPVPDGLKAMAKAGRRA